MEEERPRLSEAELVRLLADIVARSSEFGQVRHQVLLDRGLRPDITLEDARAITLIEVRRTVPQTERRIVEVIDQLSAFRAAAQRRWQGREISIVLALPGVLSKEYAGRLGAAGIQIWDRNIIVEMASGVGLQEEAQQILGYLYEEPRRRELADNLQDELRATDCGRPSWSRYQKLVGNILEYLFCPPLGAPIMESANSARVNRRDLILPNYAPDGFWAFMRSHYRADFIVVDAKNYCLLVTKPHVLQLANYLAPHGTGMFGIVVTRKGLDAGAAYTCREQWMLHSKLILALNDDNMIQMLESKKSGDEPEALIRQKIEDFRLGM